MATLEKIRNQAGLLIAVVGIALFAFIIGDFLNSGTTYFGTSRERVGKVAGTELTIFDFQRDIATATEVAKSMNQPMSDGDVRDMVWRDFIEQSLLNSEAAEIGMSVTPAELEDVTLGANIHPLLYRIPILVNEQGVFDPERLKYILSQINRERTDEEKKAGVDEAEQLRNYWLFWENRIKQQVLFDKYQKLLIKSMSATDAFASILADLNSKETDAVCARKLFYTIPDSTVTITDADLQAKYNAMKEQFFKTEGFRSVKTVTFDIIPSQKDSANAASSAQETKTQLEEFSGEDIGLLISQVTDPSVPFAPHFRPESEISEAFKTFAFSEPKGKTADVILSGDFYKTAKIMSDIELRPDSVKISHILIQRPTDAEAQRVADSLVVALNGGADFTALVGQFSVNQASVSTGGDLGWFREGGVGLEGFDNTVFTAKTGSIVTVPIPQQGGVHVIKITERTTPIKKVKLAEAAIKIEPSSATYSQIYNQANQFILANSTLEAFETAAKTQGLTIRQLDRLAKNQSSVYYFEQSRDIIKWAWENEEGAVSKKVFEVPNMVVVAAVYQAVEEGFTPFVYVADQVKAELLKDKKTNFLISEMTEAADLASISPVDTLKNIKFNQNSSGNIGREPVIPAIACATNVGEKSVPVRGSMGVYVLKVLDRRDVPAEASEETRLLNDNISSTVSRGIFESLKKKATIEDNRFIFF